MCVCVCVSAVAQRMVLGWWQRLMHVSASLSCIYEVLVSERTHWAAEWSVGAWGVLVVDQAWTTW